MFTDTNVHQILMILCLNKTSGTVTMATMILWLRS